MSPYTVLVLCIQICLIQSVFSQVCCGSKGYSSGSYGISSGSYSGGCGSYGGQGCGQVGVNGDIQACGNTCVQGCVPVLGSVCFDGCAPACGSVSICGQCCGCGCPGAAVAALGLPSSCVMATASPQPYATGAVPLVSNVPSNATALRYGSAPDSSSSPASPRSVATAMPDGVMGPRLVIARAPSAQYGGAGTGQVSVSGDIDASGQTVVVGSVPVLGTVDFNGTVAASGTTLTTLEPELMLALTPVGLPISFVMAMQSPQPYATGAEPLVSNWPWNSTALRYGSAPDRSRSPDRPSSVATAMPDGVIGPSAVMSRSPPLLETSTTAENTFKMSRFAVVLLCVQAFLIQAAFSQQCGCIQNYAQYSAPLSAPSPISYASSSYGGSGTGQVGVSGSIDADGQTAVVGSVPVLGAVDFGGKVAAAGSVSISGQCGCGCQA
ncbi:uncharacterized protein LOC125238990 [Leguminivora glycinivorella]|uniref:uncharacterized protein LOC125238990 n=1 Tax=Leguminivora glycinivorella TaxID=1035111 RepID=UPI00200F095E|nr:uncharacterized protein LOC125238990 [Leguminivora glycinivorella]